MGPASYPAIVLSLLLALFMPKSGAWDGPRLAGLSDAPIKVAAMAPRHASSRALVRSYSLCGSRLHVRFQLDARSIALATLAADAEVLGIRVGIQHDELGFALSYNANGLFRSFSALGLPFFFRISA
jgi:hypothetical protein